MAYTHFSSDAAAFSSQQNLKENMPEERYQNIVSFRVRFRMTKPLQKQYKIAKEYLMREDHLEMKDSAINFKEI